MAYRRVVNRCAQIALCLVVTVGGCARAEDPGRRPTEKPDIARLVRQLGDPSHVVRKTATTQLKALGVEALPELKRATNSTDPEVRNRATKLYESLVHPTPERLRESRTNVGRAFLTGDHERMVRFARSVTAAEQANVTDWLWLGHACQLDGNWADAVAAYHAAIRLIDQLPPQDRRQNVISPGAARFLGSYKGLRSRVFLALKTAQIQLEELGDREGAAKRLEELIAFMKSVGYVDEYQSARVEKMLAAARQEIPQEGPPPRNPTPPGPDDTPTGLFTWTRATPSAIAQTPEGGCKLAELADGSILAVWGDNAEDIRTCKREADGKSWGACRVLPFATIFPEYAPAMASGPDGRVHLVFFSKRICLLNPDTGGDTLWYTSTKDGEEWSGLRPIPIDGEVDGWPVSNPSILPLPDGSLRFFWRNYSCYAEDTKAIPQMRPITIDLGKRVKLWNPQVALTAAGRYHMVFDDFGRDLYYCSSADGVMWSSPVCLLSQGRYCDPQILDVRGQKRLLYESSGGAYLGSLEQSADGLSVQAPVQISTHRNPLRGARGLTTRRGEVLLVVGAEKTWLLESTAK